MQSKNTSLILVKSYCRQGHSQLGGVKQPILIGIRRVLTRSCGLLVLLFLSACASIQPQQTPTEQPTENQQQSDSRQSTQSSADQTESTPQSDKPVSSEPNQSDGPVTSESNTGAPQSPSDLNQELSESLGTFDEELLSEQEKIDDNRPFEPSGQSTGFETNADSDLNGIDSDGSISEETTETADSEQSPEQQTRGQTTSTGAPSKQTTKTDGSKAGVDGSDDDIVARQLREAAEKEQDPQLKEKLWEEYYRYKQENSNE